MKISVVLPTMNEEKNVEELGKKLYNLKQLYDDLYEAVFVLNNSTDGTEQILQNMQKQSEYEFLKIEKSESGRGAAMRRGVKQAQGDTIILMDSDGQYDPIDIPKLVRPIAEGYDIVFPKDYESRDFLRRLYSRVFTKFTKLLLGVEYAQPGFKAGTKKAFQDIFDAIQNVSQLDIDIRLANEAVKLGYKISDGEVDAVVHPRKYGETTFTPSRLAIGLFYTTLSLAVERKTRKELPFPRILKEFTLYPNRR